MNEFDFCDLFVFDMANNHQGDVDHGLKMSARLAKWFASKGLGG